MTYTRLPSNVADWLKSQGTYEQQQSAKKIAKWLNSINRSVIGGVSIGKTPQTLILDIRHQGSEIYINSSGQISFHGTDITTKKEFMVIFNKYHLIKS